MGLFNKITDSLKAADFDVKGQMKVKSLTVAFKKNFGCTLRVYKGSRFADKSSTLASIRSKGNAGTGEAFKVRASWKVKELEDKILENLGVKVQVALADDSALADNDISLGDVRRS